MSTPDRDERLRRVERARQAGRLDVALGELEALVAQFPDDLSLANALGDLLVSHGQPGPALPQAPRQPPQGQQRQVPPRQTTEARDSGFPADAR